MTALEPQRVLVVDDDSDTRSILTTVLRQHGLPVDAADGGAQAIELLREHRYAVVVLDLMMPDVDGFGVLDAMHTLSNGEPPVVLVVSGAERSLIQRLDASRIHGVVRKPFDPQELADVVAACVEIRGRNILGTMALATMFSTAPFIALLKL